MRLGDARGRDIHGFLVYAGLPEQKGTLAAHTETVVAATSDMVLRSACGLGAFDTAFHDNAYVCDSRGDAQQKRRLAQQSGCLSVPFVMHRPG